MAEFNYDIKKHLTTLSETGNCSKELNLISYNGSPAKYDIRTWKESYDGKRILCKGITLSEDEMKTLCAAYINYKKGDSPQ